MPQRPDNQHPENSRPDAPRRAPAGTRILVHKDGPQRVRVNGKWWSPEAEAAFLDHLAASCNVAWSAAQAGFSAVTVYNRRRADPAFARRWQEALDDGYVRLETELLGAATRYVEQVRADPELPLKHMSVREARALLERHKGAPETRGGRFQARPRSLDEMRESILAKLEAIEAARRAEAETEPAPEPAPEPAAPNEAPGDGPADGPADDQA